VEVAIMVVDTEEVVAVAVLAEEAVEIGKKSTLHSKTVARLNIMHRSTFLLMFSIRCKTQTVIDSSGSVKNITIETIVGETVPLGLSQNSKEKSKTLGPPWLIRITKMTGLRSQVQSPFREVLPRVA
jgi:hypothetical protein